MVKLFNTNGIESDLTIHYLVNLNQLSTKHFNAMNRFKRFSTLVLFAATFFFGACSQDETMDDIIENTEIGAPIQADDETGNGENKTETDPPETGSNPG